MEHYIDNDTKINNGGNLIPLQYIFFIPILIQQPTNEERASRNFVLLFLLNFLTIISVIIVKKFYKNSKIVRKHQTTN